MNEAKIKDSIYRAIKLLKEINLYSNENRSRKFTLDKHKFSDRFISASQTDDYNLIYKIGMEDAAYDILLKDNSFLQFSMEIENSKNNEFKLRYAYYQSPNKVKSYEGFLESIGLDYDECGDTFLNDYDQYVWEGQINKGACPIRYDFDYELYKGLNHSISHIHIGHNNEVRISTGKILLPEKFILFIIRNVYPNIWIDIVENQKLLQECLKIKAKCEEIDSDRFSIEERNLLHLI